MAQLKDSLITGDLRVTGTIYGNATSATALKDKTNNTLTYSNYGAAGLAGSSISWMTCWNGYELRAISKAETFNLVRDNGGNSTWVNVSGDTMTGALNFANNTYNKMGDDAQIGDQNQAGRIAIKGINGNTGIYFAPYSGSTAQSFTIDGAGTATLTGSLSTTNLTLTNTTDATSSTAAGMKTAGGLAVAKKIWLGNGLGASSNNNNSSHLIISSSDTGAGGNVALELWRGTNASWQISNESGNLHFRTNYTTAKQATYSVDAINIAYNTGNTIIKGTVTAPTFIGAFNGTLSPSAVTIANGDKLAIVDSSNSNKVTPTSITFDGSTTTKALTPKGTWETFNNYSHPTGDGNLHVPATGTSNNGKVLKAGSTAGSISWGTLSKSDVGLGKVANTTITVTSTSVSDGTNTFNKYTHPTSDGNKHIPANGTGNNGKFLQATATAGSYQWATPTDTKNTAGSTNSVSKIFLIGATSQAANPQTYSNGQVYIAAGTSGSSDGYLYARRVYNAVWNDYAEYRLLKEDIETPYGKVLIENGDDSVSVSTKRLQPGAMICSDTFGHCMGEEEHSAPISVAGRVLAYPLEPREQYNFFIGQAVCSGPNGTVSIMTKDEVKEYPECVVGYISAVPQYEEWGQNKIKVDGRIWIKVK